MIPQRPKPCETYEEVLKQAGEFQSKSNTGKINPSAKVLKAEKRKTDDSGNSASSSHDSGSRTADKPRSKFAEANLKKKKKKKALVDNTIFNEAVALRQELKCSVIGPIIERNVPSLSPLMAHWNPLSNPRGFPFVPHLKLALSTDEQFMQFPGNYLASPRKSIYMKQIEKEKEMSHLRHSDAAEVESSHENIVDDKLMALGDRSYILDENSSLGQTEEAARIHDENISRLSAMTHEERLKERNELMAKLSPDQISFLKSLRQRREQQASKQSKEMDEKTSDKMEIGIAGEVKEDRTVYQGDQDGCPQNLSAEVSSAGPSAQEPSEAKEKQSVRLEDLPISPEEAKKWPHMDKLEAEKLKWMTQLSKPKPLKKKEGYIARFSFEGDLLPYDTDISYREGLHHHGQEPERAGYTLDELFVFVRSTVVQQRHLGLKTLANILRNASEGLYDACFETSLLQLMIDAGLILLLRFAVDETTALVYQEGLRALYFLVSSEPDERCLSLAEPWFPLGIQPGISSLTHSREKDRKELDAEEKELKDVEIIKLDAIRALLRMDIHHRLRYLLESIHLSPPDVIHIIGILKRIARHSLTSAWILVNTPNLIGTIVKNFIPHNTTHLFDDGENVERLTNVYGIPLSHALSFIKVLVSRGREIAAKLADTYDLMSIIMAYVSLEPTEISMPLGEVLALAQEAYLLWSIFLSYGLTKSQQGLSTFYPLFVKQLLFYRDKINVYSLTNSNNHNYEIGAHMTNVLTKGLCVAATKSLLTNRLKNNEASVNSTDGKNIVLQPPSLDWKEFQDILPLVEICLTKFLKQMLAHFLISFSGYKFMGSLCTFFTSYLEKWRDQISFEGIVFVQKVQLLLELLDPILEEKLVVFLDERLRKHSSLCSQLKPGKSRDPNNLGSLWSVCEEGKLVPVLQEDSPFPFLLPLTKLLKTMYTLHPGLDAAPILSVLNSEPVTGYLKDICSSQHSLGNQWFSKIEIYTVTNLLQLASLKGCRDYLLYHRTALTILPLVHEGDEHIIKSLITDVICNVDFVQDLNDVDTEINTLTVKEYKPLKSPAVSQPIISPIELTRKLVEGLPSVGQNIIKNVLHSAHLEESLIKDSCIPFLINDLMLERKEEIFILDHYWCLTPLKLMVQLNEINKSESKTQVSSEETIFSVVKWLQMTFLLLKYRKSVTLAHTTVTGWFRHLSSVYLASNDIFLDVSVNSYLQACLMAILDDEGYKELSYLQTFPGLPPCYEWYKRMVEHFAAVSYGDSSFALFIIVPLMQKWPTNFKLLLIGEYEDALPFIRLSVQEVSQFIPMESFLYPPEEDLNVIVKYRTALSKQLINKRRSPFLYQLAVHHINHYQSKKIQTTS